MIQYCIYAIKTMWQGGVKFFPRKKRVISQWSVHEVDSESDLLSSFVCGEVARFPRFDDPDFRLSRVLEFSA